MIKNKNHKTGFWHGFILACQGLKIAFKNEINFRIQLAVGLAVIGLGWLFKIQAYDWIKITFLIALVLASELFNSALEYIVDLISPDYHLLAKQAKDTAAAAVLVISLASAVIGLIIFLSYIH